MLSLAGEHDLVVLAGDRREGLLGELGLHGKMLGAGDVPALEIAGGADVDEDRAAAIVQRLRRRRIDLVGTLYDVLVILLDDQPLVVGIGEIGPGALGNASLAQSL